MSEQGREISNSVTMDGKNSGNVINNIHIGQITITGKEITPKSFANDFVERTFPNPLDTSSMDVEKENIENFLDVLRELLRQDKLNIDLSENNAKRIFYDAIAAAARNGDEDMHKILAKLMIDINPEKSILNLTAAESIKILPSLDISMVEILLLSFYFTKSKCNGIKTDKQIAEKIAPTVNKFKIFAVSRSHFEFLESMSCGKISLRIRTLESYFRDNYPDLFEKKSDEEIKKAMCLHLPNFEFLSRTWGNTFFDRFEPTSVGGLIGLTHYNNNFLDKFVLERFIQ